MAMQNATPSLWIAPLFGGTEFDAGMMNAYYKQYPMIQPDDLGPMNVPGQDPPSASAPMPGMSSRTGRGFQIAGAGSDRGTATSGGGVTTRPISKRARPSTTRGGGMPKSEMIISDDAMHVCGAGAASGCKGGRKHHKKGKIHIHVPGRKIKKGIKATKHAVRTGMKVATALGIPGAADVASKTDNVLKAMDGKGGRGPLHRRRMMRRRRMGMGSYC